MKSKSLVVSNRRVSIVHQAPAEQPEIGKGRSYGAAHALGYAHPGIVVGPGVVSPLSYHPSSLVFVAVYVGGGRVEIGPVLVYCGIRDGAARAFEMTAGGQGYEAVALAGICPAPLPPVCHGR